MSLILYTSLGNAFLQQQGQEGWLSLSLGNCLTGIWHARKLCQGSFPLSLYPFPLSISFPSLSLYPFPLSLSISFPSLFLSPLSLYLFPLSLSIPFPPLSLYPFPPLSPRSERPTMCVCVCVIIDVLCRVAFKPLSLCSFIIQFAGLF